MSTTAAPPSVEVMYTDGDLTDDVRWMKVMMLELGLTKQDIQLVLGVNAGRVNEWLSGARTMPTDSRTKLTQWIEDGMSSSPYWVRSSNSRRLQRAITLDTNLDNEPNEE